jgi:predicted nuclease with TOPRIM domain
LAPVLRGCRRGNHELHAVDKELGQLEDYLIRLQDEITDVKVRLTELRAHRLLDR